MVKVLIADDEVIELNYLGTLFENESDFEVVGKVENGSQAVAYADRYKPDVIVMDINMPLDGLTAAKMIREQNPGVIIILNTAYDSFEYAREAVSLHLDGYLLKPASDEEILATVRECFRHKKQEDQMENDRGSYPHEIADELFLHVSQVDGKSFEKSANVLVEFLDVKNEWDKGYNLYLGYIVFSIEQQLKTIDLSEYVCKLVDCSGCLAQLEHVSGEALRRIMIEFFRRVCLAIQTVVNVEVDPLQHVMDYIREQYAEPLTLQMLADMVHFSPGHLSRRFKQTYGMTLNHFITQVRIEQATERLIHTDQSIYDIALDCGFSNTSHFFRVFKQYTGTTPGNIRKNTGKTEE